MKRRFPLRNRRRPAPPRHERRGTIIVVILALLTLLALLGVTFFTFARQEDISSQYFADSAKAIDATPKADVFFDWALEQLILGAPGHLNDSVLYGRKHSLVPNLIGDLDINTGAVRDAAPHSGAGRHIGFNDANGNRIRDAGENAFFRDDSHSYSGTWQIPRMNFTPGANGGSDAPELTYPTPGNPPPTFYYSPDAGYTYPDINSPFLAYVGKAVNDAGAVVDVIIPSFLRPQLLRDANGQPINNFATRTGMGNLVLRPHVEQTNAAANTVPRFLQSATVNPTTGNPVQPFPFPASYQQGIWSFMPGGVIEYDVDNDGDGTKEGIWMDLDFPVQELPLPDGRKYIAMFSYTVLDGDAKLNLNLDGQLNSTAITNVDQNFGGGQFVTKSNQGLSPAEINAGRALFADLNDSAYVDPANRDAAIEQHKQMFSIPTGTYPNRLTTSNMETAMLLWGRPHWNTSGTIEDLLSGRWGDIDRLNSIFMQGNLPNAPGSYPRAGNPNLDDNHDTTDPLLVSRAGTLSRDPRLSVSVPPFVHPFDLRGVGATNGFGLVPGPTGARRNVRSFIAGNPTSPAKWLLYPAFQNMGVDDTRAEYVDSTNGSYVIPRVRTYRNADPSLFAPTDWRTDDADETVVDRSAPTNVLARDDIFYPSEMAGLHLSDADYTRIGGGSRLRRLLPLNFEQNKKAAQVRRQFTTESWDRLQFGIRGLNQPQLATPLPPGPAPRRPWEFGWEDFNNDGTLSQVENWDGDQQNDRVFPPAFGTIPSRHDLGGINPNDPFRPEVRRLLTTLSNNDNKMPPQRALRQLPLDINRLLIGFDQNGMPVYRNLTPHPVYDEVDPNPGATPTQVPPLVYRNVTNPMASTSQNPDDPIIPDVPRAAIRQFQTYPQGTYQLEFNSVQTDVNRYKVDQEWWARYDRQRLAQDIYVLLYLLSFGDDNFNVTTTAPPADPAIQAQIRDMAQFAVNYVDALDRDDVVTQFVFDNNLSDGWNPSPTDPDQVVSGIETHTLSLSEALVIRAEELMSDDNATLFDDSNATGPTGPRHYVYVELQNASPLPVSVSEGAWRIRCVQTGKSIVLWDDTAEDTAGQVTGEIPAGEQYTIGSSDARDIFQTGGGHRPSEFRVDTDGDQLAERIVPAIPDSGNPPSRNEDINQFPGPELDVDLVYSDPNRANYYEDKFELLDPSGNPSTVKGDFALGLDTETQVTFVLERLRNLRPPRHLDQGRAQPESWLEVDRMQVDIKDFNLDRSGTTVDAELARLTSTERAQALHRPPPGSERVCSGSGISGDTVRFNTVGRSANSVAVDSQLWQPHFNRDFTSPLELLSIPLYTYVAGGTPPSVPPEQLLDNLGETVGTQIKLTGTMTAGVRRFLSPEPTPGASPPSEQNRWYRLFEFLEVPSRTHQTNSNKLRLPGRINLNTLRDPHVLAALVNDERHLNFLVTDPTTNEPTLADSLEAARNWWHEFIKTRDQLDPQTGYYLPGMPGSRPFRNFNHVDDGRFSFDHTLLRDLKRDADSRPRFAAGRLNRRNLFEARTAGDIGVDNVDYHTRHRILSKIDNLTTNRSNLFYVWITVGFFEVVEDATNPNAISIGAEMTDVPGYRGFFVVDRTLLEQAYDPSNQTFDFRRFVTHRKQLQ